MGRRRVSAWCKGGWGPGLAAVAAARPAENLPEKQRFWGVAAIIVTAVVLSWLRVVGGVVIVAALAFAASTKAGADFAAVWTLAEITLTGIVVTAQAVRRVVTTDPAAAVEHAHDTETIGRPSLGDVRQAVDELRSSPLRTELTQARRALAAEEVEVSVVGESVGLAHAVDEAFGSVVREGTVNVLRHSGAWRCLVRVSRWGQHLRPALVRRRVWGR